MCDGLEMVRIHARPVETEVIEFETRGDGLNHRLVDDVMGLAPLAIDVHPAVAAVPDMADPGPTAFPELDPISEPTYERR
jgi:hypothetical protein